MESLMSLPIMIPEIILGLAFMVVFNAMGIRGNDLRLVLAHVTFCIPYVFLNVKSRLVGMDPTLFDAARDLGASPARVVRDITLPLCRPAILSGAFLALAMSLDDFVISFFVRRRGRGHIAHQDLLQREGGRFAAGERAVYAHYGRGVYRRGSQPLSVFRACRAPAENGTSGPRRVKKGGCLSHALRCDRHREKKDSIRNQTPERRNGIMKKLVALMLCALMVIPTALAEEEKVLNILSWEGYVDSDTLAAFEEETGIDVIWSPMDSIDSMLLKVTAGGGSDYDLIISSDYCWTFCASRADSEVDKSRLVQLRNLDPAFLSQTYDPDNEYVIPYMAGCPLIIYDPERVPFEITGYEDLWNEALVDSVAVLENARVLCGITLKTMGKSMNETDPDVLAQMKEKLMPLYPNIRTFGDMESYSAVTTGEASVGFMFTPFVYMVQLDHPEFKVVYPKEGLGYGIDGLVIPTGAKHVDAAHQFLDYLMRPEVAAHNAEMQYYMCVNQAAQEYLSDTYRGASVMNVPAELLADAEFIEDVGATETVYQEIYTAFKNQ